MDGDELSSLLGMEDSFTDPTEMLDLLLANGEASFPPKVEAWEESGYNFDPSNAVLFETCAVPPIYPTFESDPHDSTDPRSVSAFLSPAHFSPPTSPGESSPGESSPEIGSSELYDEVSMSDEHCSGDENSYSTNNLLGTFPNSPIDTIDPSTLHFGSVCEIEDDSSPDSPPTSSKESRKRKRTRKNPEEPSVQTAVTLPRKQLLKLSSKELDDYASRLRATRPLTPAEEKDLRRQRRLIKNRESASLSRQRRKEHMDVLEQEVAKLKAENDQLKNRVDRLSSENAMLKDRLKRAGEEIPSSSPSLGERVRKLTKINSAPFSAKSTAATAGACLAIVLFGFGLLFNAPLRTDFVNGGFTQWQPTQVVETLPPRLPVSEPEITSIAKASRASSSKGYDFPEWRIRKPLEMEGSAAMPIDVDEEEISPVLKTTTRPSSGGSMAEAHRITQKMEIEHSHSTEPEPTNTSHTLFNDAPKHTFPSPELSSRTSPSSSSSPSVAESAPEKVPTDNHTVAYLLCPQVQPIWAPEHPTKRLAPDSHLTLLLPAESLGIAADDATGKQRTLLQVLCHVKEVSTVCVNQDPVAPSAVPCSS